MHTCGCTLGRRLQQSVDLHCNPIGTHPPAAYHTCTHVPQGTDRDRHRQGDTAPRRLHALRAAAARDAQGMDSPTSAAGLRPRLRRDMCTLHVQAWAKKEEARALQREHMLELVQREGKRWTCKNAVNQACRPPARTGHGTPDSPSPCPSPICRGSGMGVPSPICRGSGVHPHPHPRFAGDRGSSHPRFPSGAPCPARLGPALAVPGSATRPFSAACTDKSARACTHWRSSHLYTNARAHERTHPPLNGVHHAHIRARQHASGVAIEFGGVSDRMERWSCVCATQKKNRERMIERADLERQV